jgi:hypothetical protein
MISRTIRVGEVELVSVIVYTVLWTIRIVGAIFSFVIVGWVVSRGIETFRDESLFLWAAGSVLGLVAALLLAAQVYKLGVDERAP